MKKGVALAGLIFWLYLFILSIELMKTSSITLASSLTGFLSLTSTPVKSFGFGWILTILFQSSGAISILVIALVSAKVMPINTSLFLFMGSTIGGAMTVFIICLFNKTEKRRDFRHGFEIAACLAIYTLIFNILLFFIEFFTGVFSKSAIYLGNWIQARGPFAKTPDIIYLITKPVTQPMSENLNPIIILILSFLILFLSLKYISSSIFETFGGENNTKKFIHKFFDGKFKTFLVGVITTAIVFSSILTIGLLIPLNVARLINLKKSIPFILGALVGTSTDVFLASLVTGSGFAISVALFYMLFRILGALIFLPNIDFLFNLTKYFSKRLLHVSRKKAVLFIVIFILLPLILLTI